MVADAPSGPAGFSAYPNPPPGAKGFPDKVGGRKTSIQSAKGKAEVPFESFQTGRQARILPRTHVRSKLLDHEPYMSLTNPSKVKIQRLKSNGCFCKLGRPVLGSLHEGCYCLRTILGPPGSWKLPAESKTREDLRLSPWRLLHRRRCHLDIRLSSELVSFVKYVDDQKGHPVPDKVDEMRPCMTDWNWNARGKTMYSHYQSVSGLELRFGIDAPAGLKNPDHQERASTNALSGCKDADSVGTQTSEVSCPLILRRMISLYALTSQRAMVCTTALLKNSIVHTTFDLAARTLEITAMEDL